MLKILYAAANNQNAQIQLARFLQAMKGKPVQIKVAAYKKSSPKGINIDWTLDCLLNIFKPEHLTTDNGNYQTYFDQVKYYNPDLIISDLEYFTSYAANQLDITLWQCSSSLLNYAVQHKYNVGLFKNYSYLLGKNNALRTGKMVNIIDNSNCNFVYSHFGECLEPPTLKDNYEWIRPYHTLGKKSVPCQHNIVAGILGNNKKVLAFLKRQSDAIAFTDFCHEQYTELWLKDIDNQEEYFCNLKNSNLFLCEGQASFLADAFYNEKYSVVLTNFKDIECITNSTFSEYLKLSATIYQVDTNLALLTGSVTVCHNEKIKLLHQKIEDLI